MSVRAGWAVVLITAVAVVAAVAVMSFVNSQIWLPPPRPANVPDDAVAIPYIAKTRLWAKCWVEAAQTRCRIFDDDGSLRHDGLFVTYASRDSSVATSELMIDPMRSGPDHLWLASGEVLLPNTNYEQHRQKVAEIIRASGR